MSYEQFFHAPIRWGKRKGMPASPLKGLRIEPIQYVDEASEWTEEEFQRIQQVVLGRMRIKREETR